MSEAEVKEMIGDVVLHKPNGIDCRLQGGVMTTLVRRPRPVFQPALRKLDPAAFGLDVTIAIAAITDPDGTVVCVSDRMISFGEIFQANDDAMSKTTSLNKEWGCAFSANDINFVLPILEGVRGRIDGKVQVQANEMMDAFSSAYAEVFQKEFLTTKLIKYGYKSMEDFRTSGRNDLGDYFVELCIQLDKFDIGTQFLVYGYGNKNARLFAVSSPGHVTNRDILKFGVIGSGHDMAMASLRRRQLNHRDLKSTIYRLLEAKFSAETAGGVGKTTSLLTFNSEGKVAVMADGDIKLVKDAWRASLKLPEPQDALDVIARSNVVTGIAR